MLEDLVLENVVIQLQGALPVLILQGDSDQQTPLRAGEILHEQLPCSELHVFRWGGQLLQVGIALHCT